ncbi:MAG: hypothetical protein KF760_17860 [Candidatus Eremiobacteraeota bacterium]|nr:hypothetical protein [Candidatus Eremiobacteraeota bacterium]MCW5869247.1 hypothetical protein [Candidatus Eremiobacteraeota bacterium]
MFALGLVDGLNLGRIDATVSSTVFGVDFFQHTLKIVTVSEKKVKRERQADRKLESARSSRCRLCQHEDRPPIESHILPTSFWQFVRQNGQYVAFKDWSGPKEVREQSSHPEPLMCRECDSSFSQIETYCRGLLSKWIRFNESVLGGARFDLPPYIEVDYAKFKLFCLLSIWRSALAVGPVFRKVQLSEKVSDRLRRMLLARNPGPATFCPLGLQVESCGHPSRGFFPPESQYLAHQGFPSGTYGFEWCGFGGALTVIVRESPIPPGDHMVDYLDISGRLPVTLRDSKQSRHLQSMHRAIHGVSAE